VEDRESAWINKDPRYTPKKNKKKKNEENRRRNSGGRKGREYPRHQFLSFRSCRRKEIMSEVTYSDESEGGQLLKQLSP